MGGELEKSTMQQKTAHKLDGISPNKNHKNKLQSMVTDENHSPNKKNATKSAIKTTNNNNEAKRDKLKKRKRKYQSCQRIKTIKIMKKKF